MRPLSEPPMLPLAELQSALCTVSLGGDAAKLAPVLIGDGFLPHQRLSIHANNTTVLLCEALGSTYRVVNKLVGDDFFKAVARLYVQTQPPRSPCLFEYGASFGDYLATVPAAAGLPYLPDVARLEWAWNESFYAGDAQPLSAAALAKVDPDAYGDLIFTPHPSLRFVSSPFPIKEIWEVNQCGADSSASVNLDEGGQELAVLRAKTSVDILELSSGGFVLAAQLSDGKPLNEAFLAAQNAQPEFDPTSTLAVLISAGAFHTFRI